MNNFFNGNGNGNNFEEFVRILENIPKNILTYYSNLHKLVENLGTIIVSTAQEKPKEDKDRIEKINELHKICVDIAKIITSIEKEQIEVLYEESEKK